MKAKLLLVSQGHGSSLFHQFIDDWLICNFKKFHSTLVFKPGKLAGNNGPEQNGISAPEPELINAGDKPFNTGPVNFTCELACPVSNELDSGLK